ncbi:hypothetical protein [Gilliamella apis]|nr:hypothetical protein [Gilliamella apis]
MVSIIGLLVNLLNPAYALNVNTVNEIHGSAPYLTYDDGITKTNSTESLLSIKLSDGRVINTLNDESGPTNPIELPNEDDRFASIQTIVPLPDLGNNNYPNVNITDLLKSPYKYYGDDDGDGYDETTGEVLATASGYISLKWEIRNPAVSDINADNAFTDITSTVKNNLNATLNICDGPYKLTISSTSGELNSLYGNPKTSEFIGSSHTYYLSSKSLPIVCYAQPSLVFNGGIDNIQGHYKYDYDGLNWDSAFNRGTKSKGYRVVNATNSGNYDGESSILKNNFPSTGSHGLHFYLLLKNITPSEVITINGDTVYSVEGGNVKLKLSSGKTPLWFYSFTGPNSGSKYGTEELGLEVKLEGPRYNSKDKSFKPMTFRLYADSSKSHLLYEFRLMRWYIAQPNVDYGNFYLGVENAKAEQEKVREYCKKMGYRIPDANDFTNSNNPAHGWRGGITNRGNENYRRQLSYKEGGRWIGGIFNEWGCLVNKMNAAGYAGYGSYICIGYPDSDWDSYNYWSGNVARKPKKRFNENSPLGVSPFEGLVSIYNSDQVQNSSRVQRAACVIP